MKTIKPNPKNKIILDNLTLHKIFGKYKLRAIAILFFCIPGCKVDVLPPVTSITSAAAFSSDATAEAVLTDLYATMSNFQFNSANGIPSLSLYAGLSADEFTLWNGIATTSTYYAFYTNNLVATSASSVGSTYWDFLSIYKCNDAIKKISASTDLTPAVKQQLLGEAKFMRAFYYFYMVNLYGDLPLALGTDYTVNAALPRSPKADIYNQIISDLKDAQTLLSPNYLNGSLVPYTTGIQRVRPTSWAATTLLAKAYLFSGDFANAEAQATTVINNSSLFSLATLANAFKMNSSETIWALQPVTNGNITNTQPGAYFNLPTTGPDNAGTPNPHPVYLSDTLLKSFEPGDQRKVNWVGSVTVGTTTYSYPNKYKVGSATASAPVSELTIMLRLPDVILIRSEARAQLGETPLALADLNLIRNRAFSGGGNYAGLTDKTSLLSAIFHERQIELFSELGNRWIDINRNGTVDALMTIITPRKSGAWRPFQHLYPIIYGDILRAVNVTQNPGY